MPAPVALAAATAVAPPPAAHALPEVLIEDPSHEPLRDLRAPRLDELIAQRRARHSLSDEYRNRDRGTDEGLILSAKVRSAEQEEERLQEALEKDFLPQHSPNQLISPQVFFESRLFNVRSRAVSRERFVEFALGPTPKGNITYAGPELRQSDGLVFMAVLNIARDARLGKQVSFEPDQLCRGLWGSYNGEARNRLRDCIFRLQHAVVRFDTFSVQLVQKFEFPKRGRWSITVDGDIVELFKASRLIWLDLQTRKQLPEGLATWLYTYIESQTQLIPYPLEVLRERCGSEASPQAFRDVMARALRHLASIGVIDTGWSIKDGRVHWRKA